MKKCPKCGETYDDSWKVCLNCSTLLTDNMLIKESNPELSRKSMENKRPRGIMIYSVLFILIGLFSAFGFMQSTMMLNMNEEEFTQYYVKTLQFRQTQTDDKFKPENLAQTQYRLQQEIKEQKLFPLNCITIFIYLCLAVVSIGLLKLKKWASNLMPIVSLLAVLQTIIGSYFFFTKTAHIMKKYFVAMPFGQFLAPFMIYAITFFTVCYLILFISSAYYFTRPKVREQFQ